MPLRRPQKLLPWTRDRDSRGQKTLVAEARGELEATSSTCAPNAVEDVPGVSRSFHSKSVSWPCAPAGGVVVGRDRMPTESDDGGRMGAGAC